MNARSHVYVLFYKPIRKVGVTYPVSFSFRQSLLDGGLDVFVHCLHLPVCLQAHYSGKTLFDLITHAEVFKFSTLILSFVVRDDFLWYFKPANNVFCHKVDHF